MSRTLIVVLMFTSVVVVGCKKGEGGDEAAKTVAPAEQAGVEAESDKPDDDTVANAVPAEAAGGEQAPADDERAATAGDDEEECHGECGPDEMPFTPHELCDFVVSDVVKCKLETKFAAVVPGSGTSAEELTDRCNEAAIGDSALSLEPLHEAGEKSCAELEAKLAAAKK